MANDLTINQISTILNTIVKQATGTTPLAVVDTSSFVTVAQTGLKAGYDPFIGAMSQVLSKTIFSNRPYTRKFKGLEVSPMKYGNMLRKINPIDRDFEDDNVLPLTDDATVDHYKIKKPLVQQLNFYGQETYSDHVTIPKTQLDTALTGPEQFAEFVSMTMQNISDRIEQAHESLARMILCNFIAGVIDNTSNTSTVIHCLTEYNAVSKSTLTAKNIFAPENLEGFTKWLFAKIQTVSDLMTERSSIYHQTLGGLKIQRHTPYKKQKLYLHNDCLNNIRTSVLSSVFHDSFLQLAEHEKVAFWQSITSGNTINVTPSITNVTGEVETGKAVNKPILALLFDQEALGYCVVNQWSMATPMNASGGYTNMFWHFTDRYINDFTENGVVFVLD